MAPRIKAEIEKPELAPEVEKALEDNAPTQEQSNSTNRRGKHLRMKFDAEDFAKEPELVYRYFYEFLSGIGELGRVESFVTGYNAWLVRYEEELEKEEKLKKLAEELGLSVSIVRK